MSKRAYIDSVLVDLEDLSDVSNDAAKLIEQLKATNKQLLSALESMTTLFPERPVKDGSGGVGWCDHVGEAYDQAQKAITNAKQVRGE